MRSGPQADSLPYNGTGDKIASATSGRRKCLPYNGTGDKIASATSGRRRACLNV